MGWSGVAPASMWGACIGPGGWSERTVAPAGTVAGEQLYLAFSDKTGCARIATGRAAQPGGAFKASPCLVEDASDVSLFVDHDGAGYLIWGGGSIAKLAPGFVKLAEAPRFLKPDQSLFAKHPPVGKDWPVRTRVGTRGTKIGRAHV